MLHPISSLRLRIGSLGFRGLELGDGTTYLSPVFFVFEAQENTKLAQSVEELTGLRSCLFAVSAVGAGSFL